MSVKLMSMVWERMATSSNETLLALAIADYANDLGEGIYPSLATLARKSRQSESTTRRQIKQFLQAAWLIRVNCGTGGRNVTNEYRINPEWIKGVRLEGFPELDAGQGTEGLESAREPSSEGSGPSENPSTAVTGNAVQNPVRLTPFQESNPSTAVRGFSPERVSNGPQKGVTAVTPDPLEPKNSDAHAPARRGARERESNPDPSTAERLAVAQGYWVREVTSVFLDTIGSKFAEFWRHPLDRLPQRLADLVREAAAPIAQHFAAEQRQAPGRSRELGELMRARATAAAEEVCSIYRNARAAAA